LSSPSPSTRADAAAAPRSWRRWLLFGVPALVVVAGVLVWHWPSWQLQRAISDLNSDNPQTRESAEKHLRSSGHPDVNDVLLVAVEDRGNTFDLRRRCATILKQRNRLSLLDGALRQGDVTTRAVILAVLFREEYFRKTYLEDASFRVRETLLEWLRRDGDEERGVALQIAIAFRVPGTEALLAPLLRRSETLARNPGAVQEILIAAGEAVVQFRACDAAPLVLDLAASDPDDAVRVRSMDAVERLFLGPPPVCPDAVPAARVKEVVLAALDAPGDEPLQRSLRMKAMLVLRRQSDWVREIRDRLVAVLESRASGAERRQALEALVTAKDPALLEAMPRWFHDRDADVRSSAVLMAPTVEQPRLEGCLVGIVRDEPESAAALEVALRGLARSAGQWLGMPDEIVHSRDARAKEDAFKKFVDELFRRGESRGVTRDGLATTWFRWWAGTLLKLTPEQVEKAVEVRAAFQRAMEAGDVAAGRVALEAFGTTVPGLFAYEQGWLASRTP
jgi:hypothetical protein